MPSPADLRARRRGLTATDATIRPAGSRLAPRTPAEQRGWGTAMSAPADDEETGIGRATLYKYFSDVEAILVAWHLRQVSGHLKQRVRLRDRAGEPCERLETVLAAYALIHYQHHGTELAALLHQGEHLAHANQQLNELIRGLPAEAATAGAIRDDVDPAELATYCLHAITAASELPSKAAVRRLVQVTLTGLRPASGPSQEALGAAALARPGAGPVVLRVGGKTVPAMRREEVAALAVMLRSARSVLAFDLHAADRVLGVADASAEALPVPREPVQRRNSRPRGHLLNTLWGYGYQPSLGLFSPDGKARLSSQDPVSSLHRDGPGDCTVSRHFAVPAGLPGDGVVWVAGETAARTAI